MQSASGSAVKTGMGCTLRRAQSNGREIGKEPTLSVGEWGSMDARPLTSLRCSGKGFLEKVSLNL